MVVTRRDLVLTPIYFGCCSLNVGLLEEPFELILEISSGDRAFGGVSYSLFAEVVESKGSCWGEATAPGLLQYEPHQL